MNGAVVLVIEDLQERHTELARALRGKNIKLVQALSKNDAKKRIEENINAGGRLQVDTVVVNACLGNHLIPTDLIDDILSIFSGEIIGTSNEEMFQRKLKEAGCHYVCDHDSLPRMITHVLGL